MISKQSSADLSRIVVNICSPMQLIMSVLNIEETVADRSDVLSFFFYSLIVYIVMIILGYLINILLRVPKVQWGDYHLMTVFGNCGFIGIPVAQALLGSSSLIYVAIFNLCYNLFMYTYGLFLITSDTEGADIKHQFKCFLNPGTIAALVTVCIFWFQLEVPEALQKLCTYAGQPATFLALVVIGMSLADMSLRELFVDKRFFIFTIIRFILFPIIYINILKYFITDSFVCSTMALMIAMPVGNMPAMMRAQYQQDDHLLAKGAVVTTMFSVVTITIVCMFI